MINRCLLCEALIPLTLTVNTLFHKPKFLCEQCTASFTKMDTRRCEHCHKKLAEDEMECRDCLFLAKLNVKIEKIYTIADYTPFVKSMILQYKGLGDYVLSKAFAEILLHHYSAYFFKKYDYIIAMPISKTRLHDRGFNQVAAILDAAQILHQDVLGTQYRDKQSRMTKKERLQQTNVFYMKQPLKTGARILLIDDIYTTGLTVHQAASVLLSNKDCRVEVLAFARA